jgi:hypothetical protein
LNHGHADSRITRNVSSVYEKAPAAAFPKRRKKQLEGKRSQRPLGAPSYLQSTKQTSVTPRSVELTLPSLDRSVIFGPIGRCGCGCWVPGVQFGNDAYGNGDQCRVFECSCCLNPRSHGLSFSQGTPAATNGTTTGTTTFVARSHFCSSILSKR